MRSDYSLIFQDDARVAKYERVVYAPGSYWSAVSNRQGSFLRRLVASQFAAPPVHHDFACGTGRVLRMLAGRVAGAHGYDVAAAMLAAAREADTDADLHLVDADGPVPAPAETDGPALVTAFRLLLNAAPEVRDRAMAFAAAALPRPESGLLVLENHGRRRSLRHLSAWRHRTDAWYSELSDAQVGALLNQYGFEPVSRHGFALSTQGCHAIPLLRGTARLVDDRVAHRLAGLATDVLYVARRRPTWRREPASSEPSCGTTTGRPDADTG